MPYLVSFPHSSFITATKITGYETSGLNRFSTTFIILNAGVKSDQIFSVFLASYLGQIKVTLLKIDANTHDILLTKDINLEFYKNFNIDIDRLHLVMSGQSFYMIFD